MFSKAVITLHCVKSFEIWGWGAGGGGGGESCLIIWGDLSHNMGRVVSARVFTGASCLWASCLWSKLSLIRTYDVTTSSSLHSYGSHHLKQLLQST